MMEKTVRIFDLSTKKITAIPAAELAPGMVEADVQGVGRVWIPASEIRASAPHQHASFPEATRQRLREIKAAVDDVFPKTLDAWEDTFHLDSNPEQEIAMWEHIATVYRQCKAGKKLSQAQRREYLVVILACSNTAKEHVLNVVQLEAISRNEAERAIELFHAPQG